MSEPGFAGLMDGQDGARKWKTLAVDWTQVKNTRAKQREIVLNLNLQN